MPWAYSDAIVYAIRCSGGVKLGITTQLPERVASVRLHNPLPLTVEREAWLPWHRARWMEKALHSRFSNAWIHGEWFRAETEEVRAAFAELLPQAMAVPMPDKTQAQEAAVRDQRARWLMRQIRAGNQMNFERSMPQRRIMAALDFLKPNRFAPEPRHD